MPVEQYQRSNIYVTGEIQGGNKEIINEIMAKKKDQGSKFLP